MKSRLAAQIGSIGLLGFSLIGHASAQSVPANWSGPYAGVFGGYGGGHSAQHDNGFVYTPPAAAPTPPQGENGPFPTAGDGSYGLFGAVGGGLVGFNYQFGQTVLGLEADIAGTSIRGHSNSCGTPAHDCGTSIHATADIRGRLGYAIGAFLPFVAGRSRPAGRSRLRFAVRRLRVSLADWLYGRRRCVEYKFTPQLSARVEYLHSEFGSAHLFDIVPGVPERIRTTTEIVRVGLSYSFGAPPVAPVVARY